MIELSRGKSMEINKQNIINKCNETLDIAKSMLYSGKDDTAKVREVLNTLLKELNTYDFIHEKIITFSNDVEEILFYESVIDVQKYNIEYIPMHFIYYYLGIADLDDRNYEDAISNFKTSVKYNPFFYFGYFKIAECYRKTNDLDMMQKTLLDNFVFIYNARGLAGFYSRLADCYFDIKKYDIANALYSYSNFYIEESYNISQLTKIASFEVRTLRMDDLNIIHKLLTENKIPLSVSKEMMNKLVEFYKTEAGDDVFSKAIKEQIKKILYDLTKNEAFANSKYIKCDSIGFFFEIPESWDLIDRIDFNRGTTTENTLFVIKTGHTGTISIENLGKCLSVDMNEKYKEIKMNLTKEGYEIVSDSILKNSKHSYIQVFLKRVVLNDIIIIVHNYININNNLLDIYMPLQDSTNDINSMYKDKNVGRINNIINTIDIRVS